MVCRWIDRSTESRVTRSISRQTRSANVAPPWEEKRVPILEKVTTCVQPPTSAPTSPYPPSFLPCARVCVENIQNSENVRLPKVQKYSTLPSSLGLFFSFFGEKFIFAVDPVHCWSPLVHRSIQNNFTFTFPRSAFPVFNFQFLSFQSIEIDNCYILYIDIIYVNF